MTDWLGHLRRGMCGLAAAGRNLLLPPRCAYCDRELDEEEGDWPFCGDCLARLGPETWHGCRHCGSDFPAQGSPPERCPLCRNVSLRFDAAVTLGSYHAGLRDVVLRMKRPAHDGLTLAMGRLLVRRRGGQLQEHRPTMIVPIPMFWRRRLGRGINSPDLLASCLGRSLGIPVRRGVLSRRRNTLPQAELPPSRRFENMRGAFRVRRPKAVESARILLVDDVLTTGATCSEAAKMLKQAGATYVVAAVLARAQGK